MSATTKKKGENKPKSWPVWTYIMIPILTLIPVYFTMLRGCSDTKQEAGRTIINQGDGTTIVEGNVNNTQLVTNIYPGTNASVKSSKIDLVSTDKDVERSIYRGTETFAVCRGEESYPFSFLAIIQNNGKLRNCLIKWGDGTPNQEFREITTNTKISHTFPEGNSIMQIEVETESGKMEVTSYNVFVGSNPLGSFTTLAPTTNICINEPVTFEIGNSGANSPWTVHTVSFSDGTEPFSFIIPSGNSNFRYTRTFTKASTPDNPMFTMKLTVENPCYATTYTLDQIIVKDCRR